MTVQRQIPTLLLVMAVSTIALGQNPLSSLGDPGEAKFRRALDLRLPQASLTDATRFVLNHSVVAVPLLLTAVKEDLIAGLGDSSSISRLTEMIAYAATSDSIDAIAELCMNQEERFSPLVPRVLNHAITRKREFEVAAYAADKYPTLRKYVREWLEENLTLPISEELLAQSVLKQEAAGDRNPEDFLVPLLTPARSEHFKTTLEDVRAIERKRTRRVQ
jgi:hypothetical protein